MKKGCLERIMPLQALVSGASIKNFIKELEENQVTMHGFMMIRGGKVFAEGYWKPYCKDMPHRMYSISKSVTSLAIGLMQEEGKLSLDDKICDYFPEKLPDTVHPYIAAMKISNLLTMSSAHRMTAYKKYQSDDWVEAFFNLEPTHYPGTVFSYDTSASHTLGALVTKLSGKSLLDYMWEKVFSKLSFSKEDTNWLTDPMGLCMAGSGLICTMEDIAKLGITIMNGGVYQGEQVLPKSYIEEAVKKQVDTSMCPSVEEQMGYGYQFWQTRNQGYAMYGMGGQYVLCLPEHDFVLVTTADTQGNPSGNKIIFDSFWRTVYSELKCKNENLTCESKTEHDDFSHLHIKAFHGDAVPTEEFAWNGRYEMDKNPMGIKWLRLEIKQSKGELIFENDTGEHKLIFGIGTFENQRFPDTDYFCFSSGGFCAGHGLIIESHVLDDDLGSVRMSFGWNDNKVTVRMRKTFERILTQYDGFASGEYINE